MQNWERRRERRREKIRVRMRCEQFDVPLLDRRLEEAGRRVGISVRPAIHGDRRNIAIEIEAGRPQHAPQFVADFALEARKARRIKSVAARAILLAHDKDPTWLPRRPVLAGG
jgi:hypothetical protein